MSDIHRLTIDHLVRDQSGAVRREIELQVSGDTAETLKWLRDAVLMFEEKLRAEGAQDGA